jgi:hypothetical protein
MASQRPARDIIRQDYHAIVNYKDDIPTNPLADPLIDPLLTTSLKTLNSAITTKLIPTTVAMNILDNSNIYNDLENDTPVMLATSIQPLELIS